MCPSNRRNPCDDECADEDVEGEDGAAGCQVRVSLRWREYHSSPCREFCVDLHRTSLATPDCPQACGFFVRKLKGVLLWSALLSFAHERDWRALCPMRTLTSASYTKISKGMSEWPRVDAPSKNNLVSCDAFAVCRFGTNPAQDWNYLLDTRAEYLT